MRKQKQKGVNKLTLDKLPMWETLVGGKYKFLRRADFSSENGTITIQFPAMLEISKTIGGTVGLEDGEVSSAIAHHEYCSN